eukprot:4552803-Amphidinium_carterae.1
MGACLSEKAALHGEQCTKNVSTATVSSSAKTFPNNLKHKRRTSSANQELTQHATSKHIVSCALLPHLKLKLNGFVKSSKMLMGSKMTVGFTYLGRPNFTESRCVTALESSAGDA